MKVVVDANIVFSCILNSGGTIGHLLLNNSKVDFYAPDFLCTEIEKHRAKLLRLSKLKPADLDTSLRATFDAITFMSEAVVSEKHRKRAMALTNAVDEFDVVYVALALELDCALWTGDKRLREGLWRNGFQGVLSTEVFAAISFGL